MYMMFLVTIKSPRHGENSIFVLCLCASVVKAVLVNLMIPQYKGKIALFPKFTSNKMMRKK
jgi:hypothetical protein